MLSNLVRMRAPLNDAFTPGHVICMLVSKSFLYVLCQGVFSTSIHTHATRDSFKVNVCKVSIICIIGGALTLHHLKHRVKVYLHIDTRKRNLC